MKTVVLSHRGVADDLGHIGTWLTGRSASVVRVHREDSPAIPDADLLVVLGSPNSVAEGYCEAPAAAEIDAVRRWVAADRPYIGICFGAQVLAKALGGSVARMPRTYRDYVEFETAESAPCELAGRWAVWHEDAITAPADASVMARLPHSDTVFRSGRAWGIQPHIEFDASIVEHLARVVGLADDQWVGLRDALRADDSGHAARTHALLDRIASEIL